MADYQRFDVYIPVHFVAPRLDPDSGETQYVVHALDQTQVMRFIRACCHQYGGATRANPEAAPAYKGWWRGRGMQDIEVDRLTHVFILVRVHELDAALGFFKQWNKRLARALHQDIILVMHQPVQTVGDFM